MKKKWWHGKTAYQIYPKSFNDSNGDGIGDLRGIIQKLDYLKELGVEIVWISPIYQSPFVDQGYDISDYYAIDPIFGTMEDMDELLAEAKKRDMYIVMDLVVNHCSSEHEWFKKALADPFGEYGKYFYIKEGKNGLPPCNWRSYFGGSVWEKIPGYDNLFYLHMFAKEQPDLNWENPKLRQEIYKMMNWWLEKGVAGFRLDAIINIKKDLRFQDFPADRDDGLSSCANELGCAKGVHDFFREMKEETFARHQAFSVGELFDYKEEELDKYIGDDGCFESIFDFGTHMIGSSPKGWYDCRHVQPDEYRDTVFESKRSSQEIGMMANIIENHDEPRGVSHYLPEGEVTETSKKMLGGIMMLTFGLPFLYQGQEIGMTNKEFESVEEIDDINTLDEYQNARDHGYTEKEALRIVSKISRDNARTPMQWDNRRHAGFTKGTPWLAANSNYQCINVKEQEVREDSVLSFYKELIRLRKDSEYAEAVVYGKQIPVFDKEKNLMAFYRKGQEKTLLVIANYQNEQRIITLEKPVKKVVLNNLEDIQIEKDDRTVKLEGYQFVLFEL